MLPGDPSQRGESLEKEPKGLMTAVHIANDENGLIDMQRRLSPVRLIERAAGCSFNRHAQR